jgi:hypothetical protein
MNQVESETMMTQADADVVDIHMEDNCEWIGLDAKRSLS